MEQLHFLIAASICDQAVSAPFQAETTDKDSNASKQVLQECMIGLLNGCQPCDMVLWNDQDVNGIFRLRVKEGSQAFRFIQDIYWKDSAHVAKDPRDDFTGWPCSGQPYQKRHQR